MKLNFTHQQLATIFNTPRILGEEKRSINSVSTDTRTMIDGSSVLFFAFNGKRKGVTFVQQAYDLGCRNFVIPAGEKIALPKDALVYEVKDVLFSLHELAKTYRNQWKGKIIAIAGGVGKTTVKEWLYHVLQDSFNIVRSPKSYNSQLGVALSLLELGEKNNLAIIEAGISKEGEMARLEEIIRPDYGILTNMSERSRGMLTKEIQWKEKTSLFKNAEWVIGRKIDVENLRNGIGWEEGKDVSYQLKEIHAVIKINQQSAEVPFNNKIGLENATHVLFAAEKLKANALKVLNRTKTLPQLALRMEFLEGKNKNTLINDSYNIDIEGLKQAVYYLHSLGKDKTKIAVIALSKDDFTLKNELEQIIKNASISTILFCQAKGENSLLSFEKVEEILEKTENSVILFKGSHQSGLEQIVRQQSLKHHTTYLQIDRQAIRHNLSYYDKKLKRDTLLLVMVKAASYGSGSVEMARFLIQEGVHYLGVAYADEGIELRKAGIEVPILVMNAEQEAFDDIILNNLQPAIFSLEQLDEFTKALIGQGKMNYPIHIKIETGMKRLGFDAEKIDELISFVKAQPELKIESVYSHLADADSSDRTFTLQQIEKFKLESDKISDAFNYKIKRHICNTAGIENYPEAHFEMVRLGIGLFGVEDSKHLQPVISFKTHVSSINDLKKGESVGYNRSYIAQNEERIAVLPVGYADGLRRMLGNGKGYVLINGKKATIVGNVCMDMCFVNVSTLNVKVGDEVELFGENILVSQWAKWLDTITYEVLTAISPRVKRVWIE